MNNYSKHNLYWGEYKPQKDFTGIDEAHWIVRKMTTVTDEGGIFSSSPNDKGETCLILDDEKNNFWPVMSFLDKEEIKDLIESLKKFI